MENILFLTPVILTPIAPKNVAHIDPDDTENTPFIKLCLGDPNPPRKIHYGKLHYPQQPTYFKPSWVYHMI